MKEVKEAVTKISGRRGKKCYYILCCVVEAAIFYQPKEPQMKVLLADVRNTVHHLQAKTISKALSRAVDDIWQYGDRLALQKLFGHSLIEKPSPKDLVFVLAQHLWAENQQTKEEAGTLLSPR